MGDNPANVVDALPERVFYKGPFEAWLGTGFLDLRFAGDPPSRPIRLCENLDVRFYGEIILETGNIRSYQTISLTQLGDGDIVSFRQGAGTGQEKAAISDDGSFVTDGSIKGTGTTLSFYVSEDTRWGRISAPTPTSRKLEAVNAIGSNCDLDITCDKLYLTAYDTLASPSAALDRLGLFRFASTGTSMRVLRIENTNGDPRALTIDAKAVSIKSAANADSAFRVINSTGTATWFQVTWDGSVKINTFELTMDKAVHLSQLGGGNMATVASENDTAGTVLLHFMDVPAEATDDYPIDVHDKVEIIDVFLFKTNDAGGAGDSIQIIASDGSTEITNEISLAGFAVGSIVRAETIENNILAAGTPGFYIRAEQASNKACKVFVLCMRIV